MYLPSTIPSTENECLLFAASQGQKDCQYSQNRTVFNEAKIELAVPYSFGASGLQPATFLVTVINF